MIEIHLKELMDIYNLNISQLSGKTGISRKALTSLVNFNTTNKKTVSIQYNTIEELCKFFNIGVSDLLSVKYSQDNFEILPVDENMGKTKDLSLFFIVYKKEINNEEIFSYFALTTRLTEKNKSETKTVETSENFWGNKLEEPSEINREIKLPASYDFLFEILDYNKLNLVNQYKDMQPDFVTPLINREIVTLMKSFSKNFLAELTARLFDFILDEEENEARISVNWNFGYYSWMHSNDFHLEYEKKGNTIISLDDDNLEDPFESIVTNSSSMNSAKYPNSSLLEN
ncbi:helix-turn-helix transcriptional regulator [Tetragenococcus halophilus]|uniref:helix-turn-helix domain-containing protein n=1 Tax=Tetragenococcus halophilus TaxID=51669 RepID=UPI0030E76434